MLYTEHEMPCKKCFIVINFQTRSGHTDGYLKQSAQRKDKRSLKLLNILKYVVIYVFIHTHTHCLVTKLCPILCDPMTAAHQSSLFITNSLSLLKLMSIESMMPSSLLIFCHPLLLLPSIFPSIRVFSMSQFFTSGGQTIGASVSASLLPTYV